MLDDGCEANLKRHCSTSRPGPRRRRSYRQSIVKTPMLAVVRPSACATCGSMQNSHTSAARPRLLDMSRLHPGVQEEITSSAVSVKGLQALFVMTSWRP
jgi:hypothetical protein